MNKTDVMEKLTGVFREVFADETLSLTPSTTAQDVEGWDSLMHINLVVAVERDFNIRFTTREIAGLQNVGDLVDIIARNQQAAPREI